MSEALDHVRQVCAEFDRANPGWREDARERQEREFEKRKAEAEKRQQARKAREAEEKQQAVATNWYAAVDGRFHEHLANWLWGAIDERITQHIKIAQKPLVEATGDVFGQFRAQLRREFKHGIEEMCSAFGAQLAALEERLASNDQAAWAVQGRAQREEFKRALEEERHAFETKIAALEERLRAVPGILPVAKTWCQESVSYQAEFVCHDGSLWQARKDTAQAPGGSDWICVARAGHDGCDGLTLNFRGGLDAYKKYQQFDVIEFDGSSFVALRDNPGIPGDPGWQLLCHRGNRGPAGDVGPRGRKGERGARGEAMPTIVSWTIDRTHYRAVPTMSNGQAGAPLELRGLFEQFVLESSYIASTGS
jgi:hypothetical protein